MRRERVRSGSPRLQVNSTSAPIDVVGADGQRDRLLAWLHDDRLFGVCKKGNNRLAGIGRRRWHLYVVASSARMLSRYNLTSC